MKKVPLIVHIGYPKAASTLMRYQLFRTHPEVEYLGTKGCSDIINNIVRWNITKQDTLTFDLKLAVSKVRKELLNKTDAKVRIISSQEFSWPDHADRAVIAENIKAVFDPDKIIICLRKQQSWFPSQYYEERKKGTYRLYSPTPHGLDRANPVTLPEWFDIRMEMEPYQPLFARLDYWPLIDHYCNIFGKNNVGLFFFEDLVSDNFRFAESLFKFIGVSLDKTIINQTLTKANPRLEEVDIRAKEISDRFPKLVKLARVIPFKRNLLASRIFGKLFLFRSPAPINMELRTNQIETLREICSKGNREIEKYFDIDLKTRGYFL